VEAQVPITSYAQGSDGVELQTIFKVKVTTSRHTSVNNNNKTKDLTVSKQTTRAAWFASMLCE